MRWAVPFHWRGNHHAYYGVFLVVFGFFNWYMGIGNGELVTLIPLWQTFVGVGLFMIGDDIIEHTITADTPLRILFERIIQPVLRQLNENRHK